MFSAINIAFDVIFNISTEYVLIPCKGVRFMWDIWEAIRWYIGLH